ncbi:MAG: redoxin domain-containing protein [Bacteroidetes bacterium]|nr:redoxin domain-containing protein [Bacteroidota bacterium]
MKSLINPSVLFSILFIFRLQLAPGFGQDISLTIHLRGVYDSKISLLALSDNQHFKPILEKDGIKNRQTTQLTVPGKYLPGEFVLRFDYREKESSTPYPAEKYLFIHNQNLELRVHPLFCNNSDSSYFHEDEKENAAFSGFMKENGLRKEKLGLLQNLLMNYDDPGSAFYQQGIAEYEQRRAQYNLWVKQQKEKDKRLFVSHLYDFQIVPKVSWQGSETDRAYDLIDHYLDQMDFTDSLIIRTSDLRKWMDNYVNLYGQLVTTIALRDSLFPLAGVRSIEKAREGHPLVYGWMVDYFYRGYEANAIDAGMKILLPYLDDPACLTSKRKEIRRRLEGIKTLIPGSPAPDFSLPATDGTLFKLSEFKTPAKYLLLVFWSADCSHCKELTEQLYPWQQQSENVNELKVVAISLDETVTEVKAWNEKIREFPNWLHLNAKEGVNSPIAESYYILSTPVLVLLDAKSKVIISLPATLEELTHHSH